MEFQGKDMATGKDFLLRALFDIEFCSSLESELQGLVKLKIKMQKLEALTREDRSQDLDPGSGSISHFSCVCLM